MHMHENFLLYHLIIIHWYKTDCLEKKRERNIGHMTPQEPIQAVWFLSVVKVVTMVDYEIS